MQISGDGTKTCSEVDKAYSEIALTYVFIKQKHKRTKDVY